MIRKLLRVEWRVWAGLVRGLARRPDIPTGATAFTHHRAMAALRWVLVGLLVVEIAVVHLLVPPGALRLVLLVLGLYGLAWLAGYVLGSGPVRPHLVDGRRVVFRSGLTTDVVVPLTAIAQVRAIRQMRTGTASIQLDGSALNLVDNGGTSLEVVLRVPIAVALPRRGGTEVDAVRAWVDEPRAMAEAIESLLAGPDRVQSEPPGPGESTRT